MAMSGNRDYLKKYYADLPDHHVRDHRFAEEQKIVTAERRAFVEEDNAWVRYVGAPLLCETNLLNL